MARELGLATHEGVDYLDLAQWYREAFGDEAPGRLVASTFANLDPLPRPTLAHYLAMSLQTRFVITTNYDDLLERTLSALKRHPVTVIDQEEVARTGGVDGVQVVKLHGDATRPDRVVLCRDDYDLFFEQRPAMALLLEGLMLNRTFLFLGYGLRDPNFRQIYGRVGRMLREAKRPAFATSFESAGREGACLTVQWRQKGLELLAVTGASDEERERNLLLFLDHLADQVASSAPRLLLAPDTPVANPMTRLRTLLLEVADEVIELCRGTNLGSPGANFNPVANVLELLADQGWRPAQVSRTTLCDLWMRLADLAPDSTTKRQLLIEALQAAEGSDEACHVREALGRLAERHAGQPSER
jgi:hypothetical protein